MAAEGKDRLDTTRVAASLYGMLVGDALAMPAHWFYSPQKLRADYGEITRMVAPKETHAESMVQGMSYQGTIDIMHDKARFYEGNTLADEARTLSPRRTWTLAETITAITWERRPKNACITTKVSGRVKTPPTPASLASP